MNRQRAIILLGIIETIIYIPLIALVAKGNISILATIIILVVIAIITMGLLALIIRKFPPMDDK